MSESERDRLIEWLVVFTGYRRSFFEQMTDEKIEEIYLERFEKNG